MPVTTFSLRQLQSVLDRIRRLLDPSAVISQDEISEVHEEYEEIVKETNDRLQECDSLLREGHRAQALKQSEQDPDLFRVLELLEFSELPLWNHLVSEAGLVQPPAVLVDIAADLNEAYNLEKPLTDLMRMHRLHALAGSPLKTRLEFLRKITQRDAANPIWPEDVKLYERARHLQIEQELQHAEKTANAGAASQLEREVRAPGWLEPPPAGLVEQAVRIHTHLRQSKARAQIRKLADQLHEACAARDEDKAAELRIAWNGQVTIAQLPPSDAVFEQVEPVFDWLDREEERRQRERDHKAALVALDDALDNNVGRAELEKCFNHVLRFGAAPPEMARKVELRLATIEKRGRLFVWSGVVVTLACLGLVAWGVSWLIGYRNAQQEFGRQVAALQQLITEQKLNEADAFLGTLREKAPESADAPEIKKLAADLAVLQGKENERLQAREGALTAIRTAIEEDDWNKLELAMHDIGSAEKLCASDVERREVQDLLTEVRAGVRKHQDAKDASFVEELRALATAVQGASAADLANIANLKLQAEGMQNQARVSTELKRQVAPLLARLDTLRKNDEERAREQQALQQIRDAAGGASNFGAALEAYAKDFPSTTRAKVFSNIAQNELSLLPAIEGWNRTIAKWSAADFRKLTPMRAKEFLEELSKAAQELGEHPDHAGLKALEPYLEAIVRRADDAGNRTHKEMLKVLSDQRISGVEMLKLTDGQRYYFDQQPREHSVRPGEFLDFYPFLDPSLKDAKRTSIPIAKIANPRRDDKDPPTPDSFNWQSPQRRYRDGALKVISQINDDNWETQFNQLLTILETEKDLEPTLKLHLTSQVLQVGCQGSYCLEQGFKQSLEVLQMVMADVEANWLDPNDDLGKRARKTAQDALEQLQPRAEGITAAVQHYGQLAKKPRGTQYVWVGYLLKSPDGKWGAPLFAKNLPADAALVVAGKNETGVLTFTQIGKLADAQGSLATSPLLAEGRPVYISKTE